MKKFINWIKENDNRLIFLTSVSAVFLLLSIFTALKPFGIDFAWVAIILSGAPIVYGSFKRLLFEGDIKAGLLVSIALIACVIVGEYFAAGEVVVIMNIGEMLENYTVRKSRTGLKKLIELKPTNARVFRNGNFIMVDSSDVKVGEKIRVLAGESMPVDGTIVSGQTSIEQSLMTGESIPVDKCEGDEVYCATTNIQGVIDIKSTKVGNDSSIAKMIRMIEEADKKKAPILSVMDKWASYLVIIALSLSIVIALITGDVMRGITVLVVFCPCALVLATPTAIAAGIGNATKHGVIIKSGEALEELAKVTRIAFDKTGTLTIGKPKVRTIYFSKSFDAKSEQELISIISSAELKSEHPFGKAVVEYANDCGIKASDPDSFSVVAGKGVASEINGVTIYIGNTALMNESKAQQTDDVLEFSESLSKLGYTSIFVSINGVVIASIAFSDVLRQDSKSIVQKLHRLGKKVSLLTGDHKLIANRIGESVGIDKIESELLPADKVSIIEKYEADGDKTCMVGDGINDAPALKTAHIGIAMAVVGSDITAECADIVLVKDDISKLPYVINLSNRVLKKININIIISLMTNFGAIAFAAVGLLNPVGGALVHNTGSVFVVLNAALLLRNKQ